jgi:hypothetical protein
MDARSGQRKACALSAKKFIRRFLQHVLPKGFSRVRYYGFYSPNQWKALNKVQQVAARRSHPSPVRPAVTSRGVPCC